MNGREIREFDEGEMHLIYLDESGNSGLNLSDPAQPIFVLCAMVVRESEWQALEADLKRSITRRIPSWESLDRFEIHATDLRSGTNYFRGIPVADRIALRDEWMSIGADHGIKLIYRAVFKKAYSDWLIKEVGHGVKINPHVAAFALLSRCIDNYLKTLPGEALGIFISDENKEIVADVEKSIRVLRDLEGTLRLSRIVEKGFFIDSSKSLPLQLCDLFALSLRKREERGRKFGVPKAVDDSGIKAAVALLYRDNLYDRDVLEWLKRQEATRKIEAARG